MKKKRAPNNGEAPQYYVENDHEAIIPKELYMRVQEELVRRANLMDSGSRRVYSSKYALSSLVFCGHCGGIYRRIHWNNRGKKSVVWRCVGRLEDSVDKCPDSPTVTEEDLQDIVLRAVNTAVTDRDDFISKLGGNILLAVDSDFGKNIAEINSRLGKLQEELIRLVSSKSNHDAVADEIYRLRDIKNNAFSEYSERQGKNHRISEMLDFLENQRSDLMYYDDTLVRRLVEKVTVNGDKYSV